MLLGPGKGEWTESAVIGIITVWVSFKVQVLEEPSKALHTHDAYLPPSVLLTCILEDSLLPANLTSSCVSGRHIEATQGSKQNCSVSTSAGSQTAFQSDSSSSTRCQQSIAFSSYGFSPLKVYFWIRVTDYSDPSGCWL